MDILAMSMASGNIVETLATFVFASKGEYFEAVKNRLGVKFLIRVAERLGTHWILEICVIAQVSCCSPSAFQIPGSHHSTVDQPDGKQQDSMGSGIALKARN